MRDSEKFLKKWEKNRRKGKVKYVLKNCIMMGIASLIGCALGTMFKDDFLNLPVAYYIEIFMPYFLLWLLGGMLGGHVRWNRYEDKYNEIKKAK